MASPAPEERAALAEFRRRTADLSLNEFEQHDIWAMSWLRARDLNVAKAVEMIRKCWEWRKANNISTLLTTWNPPEGYPSRYPFEISGYDTQHCPVVIAPFGKWDVRKAVDDGEAKIWLKYNQLLSLMVLEDGMKKSRETNVYISQFNCVIDFTGFTLRQLTSRACIEAHMESVRQFEDNYPETLKAAFIINAPRIFTILFNIVKPLLTARTLSKIQIFDSNAVKWKAALLNNIPADQLPIYYGGTKKSKIAFGSGTGQQEDDDLIQKVVDAGGELVLQYNLEANSTISWKFKTECFDIGFCVKQNGVEVVAYERVDSWKAVNEGMYLTEKPGKYAVIFDNKYSRLRAKTLFYIVTATSADGKKILQ